MKLYGFFRSSASYRVRIALNFKGLQAEQATRKLRAGEHRAAEYLAINPQGLLPTLVLDDGRAITQSLAIIEWLEEIRPAPPLLPKDPYLRARIRAFALAIACDIHPVQNLKVLLALKTGGFRQDQVDDWARLTNHEGLLACAKMIEKEPGPYCFGSEPTLADVCLVPQMANARRFGVEVATLGRLVDAEKAALALPSFFTARPEAQPDAE